MSDTAVNTGYVPVKIDGVDLLLSHLSGEAFSTVAAYIMQKKKPQSVYSKVLATIDQVPGESLKEKMLLAAMNADHEEEMRDRFNDPNPPKSAFFDDDVMAMVLTLSASPAQPEYTLEKCTDIAKRVTGPVLLGLLMKVFPMDLEKKDQGSSGKSAPGVSLIGQDTLPKSFEKPKGELISNG